MYEGEINMVIHADGGQITVTVSDDDIVMVLADKGPGIPDVEKAMQEGYSTRQTGSPLPGIRRRNGPSEHEALYRSRWKLTLLSDRELPLP